ncbi:MAG: rRNA maturation RNase YbeY [Candidatus Dormibacteraeota bacterium]|nr:rRNA maturation RNase YbeY [Candidatus Dormibacteraeota bacterium]
MIAVVKAVRAPVSPARIRSVIEAAATVPEVAARLPGADWQLALKVSGDRELRRLNRRFLGDDHATDVLSFPSGDRAAGAHLGDIVISWPAVERQALEFDHPADAELGLLAVHGLLHILGWDHASAAQEAEMNRLTLNALNRSGIELSAGRLLKPTARG